MTPCPEHGAACRWWCPICLTHHPVADMVTWCIEHKSHG